jgi:hypothetical protein
MTEKSNGRQLARMVVLGIVTGIMYWLLFANEAQVLSLSSQGKWAFWIPVSIALVFSFAHGAFTGEFWDVLGVKAKKK